MSHQDRFEQEYKRKLFEVGEEQLAVEAMDKYSRTKG